MRIDLHAHTTASDGTDDPARLVAKARAAELDVIAITDHDTTAGWSQAATALPPGMTLLPGVELSCAYFGPDGAKTSIHLLGYLFDPDHPGLRAERQRLRADRLQRAHRIVENLRAGGIAVSWDLVGEVAAGGTVGRPHIARALVAIGAARDVGEAFAGYLRPGSPFYVRKADTDVFTAVRLLREAGGVPVFAHPLARRRGKVVDDQVIAQMVDAGLLGIEVDHPDHDAPDRAHLRSLAQRWQLLITGSSDYHGRNKTTGLAADLTAEEQYEWLLQCETARRPVTAATR